MSNDATLVLRQRHTYADPNLNPWKHLAMELCPQTPIYQLIVDGAQMIGQIHGRVLEVGFGTGAQVILYHHLANWVTALEVDPQACAFAAIHWPLPHVEWVEGDICYLEEEDAFDTILCIETLEHVEDPEKAIHNMGRALRPGGYCWISVPASDSGNNSLHKWSWTPLDLEHDLMESFENVHLEMTSPLILAECSYA